MFKRTLHPSFVLLLAILSGTALTRAAEAPQGFFTDVRALGAPLESTFDDFVGNTSADGLTLYFESTRPDGAGSYDIYRATRESTEDDFDNVENLGAGVNTGSVEAEGFVTADGLTLYFTSNRSGGFGLGDLWMATRETTEDEAGNPIPFANAVNLGAGVNTTSRDQYAHVSADGLTLYFNSNRPGGTGDERDIYVATRAATDLLFDNAQNLVEINTASADFGASFSNDGLTVFLSSERPGGLGGLSDLWMATRADTADAFGTAVNLGAPVNTTMHDMFPRLSRDWPASGSKLYFNRASQGGTSDMWQATWISLDAPFLRADGNGDGAVNIADPSFIASAIFVGGAPQPPCLEAADANDDGDVNIADPSFIANAIFIAGSPQPPLPFPDCGPDVDPPGLGCDSAPESCLVP